MQNTDIAGFNGRFRDDRRSDHRLENLTTVRAIVAAWRADYNER